jgi:hypothetical protein
VAQPIDGGGVRRWGQVADETLLAIRYRSDQSLP